MIRWILVFVSVLLCGQARAACTDAGSELTVDFVCTVVGGSVAVPPAAVFCDALGDYDQVDENDEVISSAVTREMHTLQYSWNFGDPGAGTWANSGRSKETDEGALAGHIYTTSGVKTISLEVRSPTGACRQNTATVTVADADTVYSGRTFCVANSAPTPGADGCPSGATAVTSSNFSTSLTTNCNVDADQVRCLFKGGDTFTGDGSALVAGTSGGFLGSYGTGKALVVGGPTAAYGFVGVRDYWTVTNLSFDRNDTAEANSFGTPSNEATTNATVYNIDITDAATSCLALGNGAGDQPDLNAFVDIDCASHDVTCGGTCGSNSLVRGGTRMWYAGHRFDGTLEDEDEFNVRFIGAYKSLINHNYLLGSGGASQTERNPIQIRGCQSSDTNCPAEGNRFVLVQDNLLEQEWGTNTVRLCNEFTCAASGGNDVSDFLIQRNLHRIIDDTLSNGAQLLGNRITYRNNVLDARGIAAGSAHLVNVQAVNAGLTATSDVSVLNNTMFLPSSFASSATICRDSPSGSGHLCYGNLVWAPSYSTQPTVGGTGWTTGSNLINETGSPGAGEYGENPFVGNDGSGTFPAQTSTVLSYFDLRSQSYTGTSPIDNGRAYGSDTSFGVQVDAEQSCRPFNSSWDVGAFEYGASACSSFSTGGSGGEGIGITGGGWSSTWEWR